MTAGIKANVDGSGAIQVGGSDAISITAGLDVGVGTTSPDSLSNFRFLDVGSSGTNQGVVQANNGTVKTAVYVNGNTGALATRTNHNLLLQTNATTAVTIDTSQNVGIGVTAASGVRLDVFGGYARIRSNTTVNADVSGNLNALVFESSGGTGEHAIIAGGNASTNYLTFYTANSAAPLERMRIDASGNVGIGANSTNRLSFTYNGVTGEATIGPNSTSGNTFLTFGTSSSGTYGEKVRITAAGDVGIGTNSSSPVAGGLTLSGSTSANLFFQNTSADVNETLWRVRTFISGGVSTFEVGSVNDTVSALSTAYRTTKSAGISVATHEFYTADLERMRIDASGYTQFSSNLVMPYQGAPTSKAAAATLTGAELVTGILNTTGTTYTITLPTGTNIEGALTWAGNNVSLDFFVINTASGTITIGANGNTTLGSLTIATGTSAQFRIRRTAANTFTVYRLG